VLQYTTEGYRRYILQDANYNVVGYTDTAGVLLQTEMEFSAVLGKVNPNGGKRHERQAAA
jgi:hypothetical protein